MKKTFIAIGVHVVLMLLVFIGPMIVMATGKTVYLETEKMDPRSLLRGHYAILGYQVAQNVLPTSIGTASRETGKPVYVVVTTDRPAQFVNVTLSRPELKAGQACIVGRARGFGGMRRFDGGERMESVDFPQIAQFFASKDDAKSLESARGDNLLAVVRANGKCNAVLKGLESR